MTFTNVSRNRNQRHQRWNAPSFCWFPVALFTSKLFT